MEDGRWGMGKIELQSSVSFCAEKNNDWTYRVSDEKMDLS